MPTLTILPNNKTVTVPAGTNLLALLRSQGIEIETPCAGHGTCGKCLVNLVSGTLLSGSGARVTVQSPSGESVLACTSFVADGDATVSVPRQHGRTGAIIAGAEDALALIEQPCLPAPGDVAPLCRDLVVEIGAPQTGDGMSGLDRLLKALSRDCPGAVAATDAAVLRGLPQTLGAAGATVTATVSTGSGPVRIISAMPGRQRSGSLGVAIDIGTTTIAACLVSLDTGTIIGTASDFNGQVLYGLDVIGRINHSTRPGGLDELRDAVLTTVNGLVRRLCEGLHAETGRVRAASIAGNTTMMHLFLGVDPDSIRRRPYVPALLSIPELTAGEIGLEILPGAPVCFAPAVGSYVGGDIAAGLLCTPLCRDAKETSLFIDIGTNGELVVGNGEFLIGCACSAGPAFEGGGIEFGMRATDGAIDRVTIDPANGTATCSVIGSVPPVGICGTGMISLVSGLFGSGWLDGAGKLRRDRPSPAVTVNGRRAAYILVTAAASGIGKPIMVSETDIDNVVRAKAAIYSACSLLLSHAGTGFGGCAGVYIAGGFGRFLDIGPAVTLGLLPDIDRARFRYLGNTSLIGAFMTLVSRKHRDLQRELAGRITYIDLGDDPSYMDQYTAALFIPHTDRGLFPSVA